MADGRKRLSGASYRKLAKEKTQRSEEVLAKVPKIHSFFKRLKNEEGKFMAIILHSFKQVRILVPQLKYSEKFLHYKYIVVHNALKLFVPSRRG